MKITTTSTTIEGTPEELAAYNAQANGAQTPPPVAKSAPASPKPLEKHEDGDRPEHFVTTVFARRALKRRPLSKEFKIILKVLYDAHPALVHARELQKPTGYSARQLAGLMGAFGRRMSHTDGYDSKAHFFDWEWADDGWAYGLPETVREAVRLEKLV
jgi:hypothetical protein